MLIELGALEERNDFAGKTIKRPTKTGNIMGIFVETRNGLRGKYDVVVYTKRAQQFIIDNMDVIIEKAAEKNTRPPENQGKPWTEEEENELKTMCEDKMPLPGIAAKLMRSNSSVRTRLKKLGSE